MTNLRNNFNNKRPEMIENGTATGHQAEIDLFSDVPLEIVAKWSLRNNLMGLLMLQLIMAFMNRFGFFPGCIFGCALWLLNRLFGWIAWATVGLLVGIYSMWAD